MPSIPLKQPSAEMPVFPPIVIPPNTLQAPKGVEMEEVPAETEDEETAKTAIQAAETGHLVLASLHTNGTAETINRLIHMGIPNYYIADCLSLIISCRLLKINNTRIGVYEVMQITNKIKQTLSIC